MSVNQPPYVMEVLTDPAERAAAKARRERFDRNWLWFTQYAQEIYTNYRGKCLCVAGEELFVGDTPQEAVAKALAAHPDDDGRFVHYVYKDKLARIYADQRRLVSV